MSELEERGTVQEEAGAPDSGGAKAGAMRTLRELSPAVRVLLFGIALNRMGSFVALFLVLYMTDLGYSPTAAGAVLTAYGVGTIAGAFAGGALTEHLGPRRVIMASMVLSGTSVALIGVVHNYVALLAIVILAGVFAQVYRPAASTLMAELTPPTRLVMVSAATRLGLNVGAAVGPLLGVGLAHYSYTWLFAVNAATNMGFALVAHRLLPELPRSHGQSVPEAEESADAPPDRPARGSYADVLRDRRFLLVTAALFLTALTEAQYQAVLPLDVRDRGLPTWVYGAVVGLNGALVIFFELPLTRFVQKLSMHITMALGSLFIGGGLSLFGIPAGAWIFFTGAVVWTAGEIISAPSVVAYPALAAPAPVLRSRYIAALTTAQTAGYAIGPSVGTTLYEFGGSLVWVMCAVLGGVAFTGMWSGSHAASKRIAAAHG
jgi:MFS family permease